jgi:hypothetical protein
MPNAFKALDDKCAEVLAKRISSLSRSVCHGQPTTDHLLISYLDLARKAVEAYNPYKFPGYGEDDETEPADTVEGEFHDEDLMTGIGAELREPSHILAEGDHDSQVVS